MTKKLFPLLSPHRTYVEVFGGGGSLLLAKDRSPIEVYNDLDGDLVNFYRVLRDPKTFSEFQRLVNLTPYAREEFNFCKKELNTDEDSVERARRFFFVARASFSGNFGRSLSTSVTRSNRRMSASVSKYLSTIDELESIHERLQVVQVENQDFRTILKRYDTSQTCFYLDPPYVHETRSNERYRFELSLEDHVELTELLMRIKGTAVLSCYWHEVYAPLVEAGWERIDWKTVCHAAGKTRGTGILGKGSATAKQPRVETVLVKRFKRVKRLK